MMRRTSRPCLIATAAFLLVPLLAAAKVKQEKLDGYAEYRIGEALVVDGQRIRIDPSTKLKLKGSARNFASIPLGYAVKANGTRQPDGSILARRLEAKPNDQAMFEGELRSLFDQTEQRYRQRGRVYDQDENGKIVNDYGRLFESGRDVERVRRITARIVPPYQRPEDYRVYVVQNEEWNAMAAPNNSIYVFTGLLRDLDDDEIAIVLGHELAHASHEHSRRQYKRNLWVQLAGAGAVAAADQAVEGEGKQIALGVGAMLTTSALLASYGRSHEDQADRVGLRYAHEGGYDVTKGPRLWKRFSDKYGESNKVVNFFFGDHSRSSDRARRLGREIEYNYR